MIYVYNHWGPVTCFVIFLEQCHNIKRNIMNMVCFRQYRMILLQQIMNRIFSVFWGILKRLHNISIPCDSFFNTDIIYIVLVDKTLCDDKFVY